jgi:hypothetical protein
MWSTLNLLWPHTIEFIEEIPLEFSHKLLNIKLIFPLGLNYVDDIYFVEE